MGEQLSKAQVRAVVSGSLVMHPAENGQIDLEDPDMLGEQAENVAKVGDVEGARLGSERRHGLAAAA